jgi:hypothetical protein
MSPATVPGEISILQLWKAIIAPRYPIPTTHVAWGNHYGEGKVTEVGKVTTLTDADPVEVVTEAQKWPSNQREVSYKIDDQAFKITVRKNPTIDEVRKLIAYAHRGRRIAAIAYRGAEINTDSPLKDWLNRTS